SSRIVEPDMTTVSASVTVGIPLRSAPRAASKRNIAKMNTKNDFMSILENGPQHGPPCENVSARTLAARLNREKVPKGFLVAFGPLDKAFYVAQQRRNLSSSRNCPRRISIRHHFSSPRRLK